MKKWAGLGRAHFKLRKAKTSTPAIDYTKKGSQLKKEWKKEGRNGPNWGKDLKNWVEFGVPANPMQGNRTDLEEPYAMAREGKSNTEIIEQCGFGVFVRCYRALDRLRLELKPEWERKRQVILLYADSGLGKTRWAYDSYESTDGGLYEMPINDKDVWFDGYSQEHTLLLDDFAGQMTLVNLLKLLDIYLRKVAVKGGHVWLRCPRIVITTNIHPSKWYNWQGRENQEFALFRRFTEFRAWTGPEDGIAPVDPDDFWPVKKPDEATMKVYRKLGQTTTVVVPNYPLFEVVSEISVQKEKKRSKVIDNIRNNFMIDPSKVLITDPSEVIEYPDYEEDQ